MIMGCGMKIFDDIFKLNKFVALKNKKSSMPLSLNVNTKNKRISNVAYNRRNQSENLNTRNFDIYKYNKVQSNLMDVDFVSEEFEKDSRRYPKSFELENGGEY